MAIFISISFKHAFNPSVYEEISGIVKKGFEDIIKINGITPTTIERNTKIADNSIIISGTMLNGAMVGYFTQLSEKDSYFYEHYPEIKEVIVHFEDI